MGPSRHTEIAELEKGPASGVPISGHFRGHPDGEIVFLWERGVK